MALERSHDLRVSVEIFPESSRCEMTKPRRAASPDVMLIVYHTFEKPPELGLKTVRCGAPATELGRNASMRPQRSVMGDIKERKLRGLRFGIQRLCLGFNGQARPCIPMRLQNAFAVSTRHTVSVREGEVIRLSRPAVISTQCRVCVARAFTASVCRSRRTEVGK